MAAGVTLLGQGLAGSLLAWELSRLGVPFRIFLGDHSLASSRVGAGIMNPVTGQRFVPSWRWEAHLPVALDCYRALEREFGVTLVRSFRIRRLFVSPREEELFKRKWETGALTRHVASVFDGGFWLQGAWQVDTARVISLLRLRLMELGVAVGGEGAMASGAVIACTGAAVPDAFSFCGLVPAEGAVIEFDAPELDPGVILNRGVWVLPTSGGTARAGSTYWLPTTTPEARAASLDALGLQASALVGRPLGQTRIESGSRVTTPDKHPVIGWSDASHTLGIFSGLGAKGALHAPALARNWARHLALGEPLDSDCLVDRFRKNTNG